MIDYHCALSPPPSPSASDSAHRHEQAATGLAKSMGAVDGEAITVWGVDAPYLLGSALFYLGAWVQMMMCDLIAC